MRLMVTSLVLVAMFQLFGCRSYQFSVVDVDGKKIKFPTRASPYIESLLRAGVDSDFVYTITKTDHNQTFVLKRDLKGNVLSYQLLPIYVPYWYVHTDREISPDGRHLAYLYYDGETFFVLLLNMESEEVTAIYSSSFKGPLKEQTLIGRITFLSNDKLIVTTRKNMICTLEQFDISKRPVQQKTLVSGITIENVWFHNGRYAILPETGYDTGGVRLRLFDLSVTPGLLMDEIDLHPNFMCGSGNFNSKDEAVLAASRNLKDKTIFCLTISPEGRLTARPLRRFTGRDVGASTPVFVDDNRIAYDDPIDESLVIMDKETGAKLWRNRYKRFAHILSFGDGRHLALE